MQKISNSQIHTCRKAVGGHAVRSDGCHTSPQKLPADQKRHFRAIASFVCYFSLHLTTNFVNSKGIVNSLTDLSANE